MAKKTNPTDAIPEAENPTELHAVTEPTETVELVADTKKVKRRKSRTTAELNELPYNKGWTDAETRVYINFLREEIMLKTNMIQELKMSCQRFNEMYQNCDTAYQKLKATFENRENFIKQVVSTAYASIMNMKEIQA